jgi:hypothetical protein
MIEVMVGYKTVSNRLWPQSGAAVQVEVVFFRTFACSGINNQAVKLPILVLSPDQHRAAGRRNTPRRIFFGFIEIAVPKKMSEDQSVPDYIPGF